MMATATMATQPFERHACPLASTLRRQSSYRRAIGRAHCAVPRPPWRTREAYQADPNWPDGYAKYLTAESQGTELPKQLMPADTRSKESNHAS
jgi:hypothetical protein